MSAFPLTTVTLQGGVDAALALVPTGPGVGQIVAAGDRNLVIGRPSNLRRWAAGHLGRARLPKAVAAKLPPRPPTDLTPIAAAIAYATTTSPFGQRLAYERLMGLHVPLTKRRDLKRPAYLRLAPADGYPHLLVQPADTGDDVFGPFRDTRAATRARDALYKHFRIRDSDFDFKPAHDLPEGLVGDVARVLDGAGDVDEVPPWVRRAGGRSIVVERTAAGLELYPIAGGSVIEDARTTVAPERLEQAIGTLAWSGQTEPANDTPWLNAWRHGKRTGLEIPVRNGEPPEAIAARIREVVG